MARKKNSIEKTLGKLDVSPASKTKEVTYNNSKGNKAKTKKSAGASKPSKSKGTVKIGRPKEKPIPLVASKGTLKKLDKYIADLESGKTKQHYKELDDLNEALNKFRNKSGELSKRNLRTKKQRQEFNKLIREAQQEKTLSAKYRNEIQKRIKKGIKKTVKEQKSKNIQQVTNETYKVFASDVLEGLLDKDSYYRLVMEFVDEDISADDVIDVLDMIKQRYELEMPSTSTRFAENDDRYKFMQDIYPKIDDLTKKGNATDEDFLVIIRDALTRLKSIGK